MQSRETKLGRISETDVIVFETNNGYTGVGYIESLDRDGDLGKNTHWIQYIPGEGGSLGEISFCHEDEGSFEYRVTKLRVLCQLDSRDEWNDFVKHFRNQQILTRIKNAGFRFGKKP